MRVAGQVRVILPLSSFAFFFPSKRILDGFIRGINNLSLSLFLLGEIHFCAFSFFFFFLKYVDEIYYIYHGMVFSLVR